ncbi:MAG: sodium:calcium antiporter [Pelagibacterales bacterium]|nr:sodium:calcium antiporter [Pelagibacterales bacterium]
MTAVIYLCLGIAILYFSGEYLVGGSVSLAKHLKVQPFVIAVTLVAFGTSAPELAISINSALKGLQGITIGNIVGSNIANVLFAIPLAYLIKISKKSDVRKKDSIFLFMITVVFCGLVINMESFDFIYGVISLSILLAYIFFIIYETKIGLRKQNLNNEDEIEFSIIKSSIFSFLGIVGVVVGAEILVHGAVLTAELIGISQVVIGLTVVALGTSLPEVAASMIAAYRGQVNFILGAILGSNLFNILGITGTASILAPIKSAGTLSGIDLSFLMLSSLIFLIFSIFTKFINRALLVVILISYLIYVLFLFLGF